MLAAVNSSPVTNHGEGCPPRTTKGQAPMVADVDHALLPVVLAKTWVSLALHRKGGLLHASHLLAPSTGRGKQNRWSGQRSNVSTIPGGFHAEDKTAT